MLTSDNLQVFGTERAKGIRRLLASPVGHQHIAFKYDDVVEHARHLGTPRLMMICSAPNTAHSRDLGGQRKLRCCCLARGTVGIRIEGSVVDFNVSEKIFAWCNLHDNCYRGERGSGINFQEFQRAYDDTLSGTFDSQFGISQERKEKLNNSIAFIKDTIYVIIELRQQH